MGKFGWSYPPGCDGPPDDDVPTGCMFCGIEPPANDQGECDFAHWVNREYCSESCRDSHARSIEAERAAEISLATDWAADEMSAEEYWRNVEEAQKNTPDDW